VREGKAPRSNAKAEPQGARRKRSRPNEARSADYDERLGHDALVCPSRCGVRRGGWVRARHPRKA